MGLAVSCAGCITETKTVQVAPETAAKIKDLKEIDGPYRDAKPQTWIAVGEVHEVKADDPTAPPGHHVAMRDEARKSYQKAIELDPKCIAGYTHLANLYVKMEDSERAIGIYKQAIQQNPKSPVLWHQLGLVQLGRQDINAALPNLAKAHEIQPDDRNYATVFGMCLARAGKPADAVQVLCHTMSKAEANFYVARMMVHINQPETSRQYVRAALADRPTHQGALLLMAQLDGPRSSNPVVTLGNATVDPQVQKAGFSPPR
jgi:tetratricopeptide (TPR) repeat protein